MRLTPLLISISARHQTQEEQLQPKLPRAQAKELINGCLGWPLMITQCLTIIMDQE